MILLVDMGNTRMKWGLARSQEISGYGAAVHAEKPIAEVLKTAWAGLPSPQRILVANVAGVAVVENLQRYCQGHFKLAPEFVIPVQQAGGVTNGYHDPAQLGADRWAAVIAAYAKYGGPVCVVGCGTAITVDTVTRTGRHLGGLIAPGIGVMHRALAAATAALPGDQGNMIELYARDTRAAVTSGIVYAATGFVERATAEIRAQHGNNLSILLTGGDAERLQPLMQGRFTLEPHLVLEGLAMLAEPRT
ncbi:MAG: type III pantothenate kinase [Gammaproteobacteria bacterium]